MSTVIVSGTYQDGNTTYAIPDGFDASNLWLLVNGQVWTGASLQISDGALTVPGIDMTDELVQLSSQAATDNSNLSTALTSIEEKLDAALTSPASSLVVTPVNTTSATPTRTTPARIQFKQVHGMCAETGKILRGIDHLRQSVRNIILTLKMQRVMLREYGMSDDYLDQPGDRKNAIKLKAQLAAALDRWEPRLKLTLITTTINDEGQLNFGFAGDYLGESVQFGVSA